MIEPLSILDARKSIWRNRKNYWNTIGMQSDKGRKQKLLNTSMLYKAGNGTSVFDPVLTETLYSWFTKSGDYIYDPFCGGSVRGIVAKTMERNYVGIDIREEQLEENRKQANKLQLDITYKTPYEEDNGEYDFIFTCPPYFNLEKYSNKVDDLSNMKEDRFFEEYERILINSVSKLKPNRFMAIVVGDVRRRGDIKQPNGSYILLPHRTIDILYNQGIFLYNDIIYVNDGHPTTSKLYMNKYRKVGKIHQNVLVFNKGDWKLAAKRLNENNNIINNNWF